MSLDAISDLVERYLNDAAFRTSFARDPEAAVAEAGFTLDESELAALHSMCLPDGSDQPLRARITKYSFGS